MKYNGMDFTEHQLASIQILSLAQQKQWPISVLECENKIVPGEKVKVLAVGCINTNGKFMLIPVARLFEEKPLDVCYPPMVDNKQLKAETQDAILAGWEMEK